MSRTRKQAAKVARQSAGTRARGRTTSDNQSFTSRGDRLAAETRRKRSKAATRAVAGRTAHDSNGRKLRALEGRKRGMAK